MHTPRPITESRCEISSLFSISFLSPISQVDLLEKSLLAVVSISASSSSKAPSLTRLPGELCLSTGSSTMSSTVATILPVGVGYGVVVGVGFFFAFVMVGISMLQVRTFVPREIVWSDALPEPVHQVLDQN